MFFSHACREGNNSAWYYILATVVVIGAMILGGIPFVTMLAISMRQSTSDPEEIQRQIRALDFSGLDVDPNLILALMLLQFAFGLGALYLMVKTLHQKRFSSLITPRRPVRWRRIGGAFLFWFVLMAVLEAVSYAFNPGAYSWNFQPAKFFTLLLVTIPLLPIQTSFEEIFIRGYWMQGIGLATRRKWPAVLITSILFALLHGQNPEVQAYGASKMMAYYFMIGLFFAIIAVMDDSLEIPLGFHFANNFYSATIVSYQDSALKTPALIHNTDANPDGMILSTILLIAFLLFRMKRYYHWPSWKKLLEKISCPPGETAAVA